MKSRHRVNGEHVMVYGDAERVVCLAQRWSPVVPVLFRGSEEPHVPPMLTGIFDEDERVVLQHKHKKNRFQQPDSDGGRQTLMSASERHGDDEDPSVDGGPDLTDADQSVLGRDADEISACNQDHRRERCTVHRKRKSPLTQSIKCSDTSSASGGL